SSRGLSLSSSSLLSSSLPATCGAAATVSMLTTDGSTRRAISANEAESASGARAICAAEGAGSSSAATRVRLSIAPIETPTTRHAAASAAIHTRSLRSIARSASVVWPFGICNIKLYHLQIHSDGEGHAGNAPLGRVLAEGRAAGLCAFDEGTGEHRGEPR